jgi:hypothetical protein
MCGSKIYQVRISSVLLLNIFETSKGNELERFLSPFFTSYIIRKTNKMTTKINKEQKKDRKVVMKGASCFQTYCQEISF